MNKKKIIIISGLILLILIGLGIFSYLNKDENISLSLSEKHWIEENKNKVIDISLINDVPIFNVNGEGVLFDFFNFLEDETGLEFNKISYNEDEDYVFKKVKSKSKEDILIYRDNYVLISKDKEIYNKTSDIKDLVIGVLEDDLEEISENLSGASNVAYKTFKTSDELFSALSDEKVNAISLEKIENFKEIVSGDYKIVYNISQNTVDYVFSLGNNETFNKIIKKYYQNFKNENYDESFYKFLSENYFSSKEIDEKTKAKFRSKRYSYGFVENMPFDSTLNKGLSGLNKGFLENFVNAASVEIDYKRYSNYERLLEDFNAGNLDIIFSYEDNSDYSLDTYETSSVYDEKVVIVTSSKNKNIYSSINSLKYENVKVIKNSKISAYLKKKNVNVNEYDNSKALINSVTLDDILALDYYSYDYYVREELKKFKIDNEFYLDTDYNFILKDNGTNKTFNEFFDFYLTFEDKKEVINKNYIEILSYSDGSKIIKVVLSLISALLILLLGVITMNFVTRRKKHKIKLSKADKLRYVDSLTSLKNRNYLNANLDKWNNTEIYPGAIIIIDLNNVAYINDNFGHTEGDKVIVEAASILIKQQVPNSEIIRTSGNEFLIYTIGKDEKEVITYCRKLNKDLKNLSHGFGAAIGYSMITDGIKSVDDAVNEATISMKNNKGEN